MRSAFSSSSESEEESSSQEDENMMDEDMETSRFRHELEAESQHVLQEQVLMPHSRTNPCLTLSRFDYS